MAESLVNQRGSHDALLLCRCCDLEQSLPPEIYWKREFGLVLHHSLKNVLQGVRLVSVLEVEASVAGLG